MSLRACPSCGAYVRESGRCPHCAATGAGRAAAAILLGLSLAACDSGGEPQALYGVTATGDEDNDGWTTEDGDCDDADATVNPDATEEVGDGIDSNCNDDDDT